MTALYAGGSLATGDFRPGISDLDLVAIVAAALDSEQLNRLRALHQSIAAEEPLGKKLHCCYVAQNDAAETATAHPYWAYGQFHPRPLTGVARAELLDVGITVFGPPPRSVLPPITRDALREAVRAELSGYWTKAIRKPWIWVDDLYVDLGLVTLARVDATLTENRLITKREAIARLPSIGVPPDLAGEIALRREGQRVSLSRFARVRRARRARAIMARGIRDLLRR